MARQSYAIARHHPRQGREGAPRKSPAELSRAGRVGSMNHATGRPVAACYRGFQGLPDSGPPLAAAPGLAISPLGTTTSLSKHGHILSAGFYAPRADNSRG